jgi:hypothetical protein
MESKILIICSKELQNTDLSFAKLSNFLGIEFEFIRLDNFITNYSAEFKDNIKCMVLNYKTLSDIYNTDFASKFKTLITDKIEFLFIYGISPTEPEKGALNYFTDGIIQSVSSFESINYKYEVSKHCKEICRQFSGLSFGPINKENDFKLHMQNTSKEVSALITIDGRPFFLKTKIGVCTLFILAGSNIIDIDARISGPLNTKEVFSRLIPPIMFIRYVFPDGCWHSPKNYANLIIDDPVLKEKYGFLNFRRVLEAMDSNNFCSTVAFIPWNFKRTSREIAKLFKENKDKFTICVHGCDHTKREFGTTNYEGLNSKIKVATERMAIHERVTGIKYEKVMVFPQGVFSTQSMEILKSNNYLAAVNTECIAVNNGMIDLKISDVLNVAVMNYGAFPLFLRRYPGEIFDCAFDLYLGKPLLIVVHHDYFKEGGDKLIAFISEINSFEGFIEWKGLGEILRRAYLVRKLPEGDIQVKAYTNEIILENIYQGVERYVVLKNEDGKSAIEKVAVNVKNKTFKVDSGILRVSVEMDLTNNYEVQIVYKDAYPTIEVRNSVRERIWIYARRYLSEIRDNYLVKID